MMTLSFFLYSGGNDDDAFDQLKLLRSRTSLASVRVRPHYAVLPFTDDTRQGWELGAEAAGANILTKYMSFKINLRHES